MAVHNATCTTIVDLITKLDTYLATRGWSADHLDVTADAGTGGEWAMSRGNIRFATSWDSENSGINLAIYQYSDQAYVIGDRPWGQDHDSGNGFAGTTPDSSIDNSRHVVLHATPLQFWVFSNESFENYAHIVVEIATGKFTHFGFGTMIKKGDWTGGEYAYGQFNNASGITSGQISVDAASFLIDGHLNDGTGIVDAELYAATIHCEGLPNQTSLGYWAVSVGGSVGDGVQADLGLDRQNNDGVTDDTARVMFFDGLRAGPYADTFYRSTGVDLSGELRMWPIMPRYHDAVSLDSYGPMGRMPDVFGCCLRDGINTDEIFTDENGTLFHVFPASDTHDGSSGISSGNLGIAYEVSVYSDPGLPAGLPTLTGRWSTFSSDDYTVVSSEITVLNDLSGNGNHFTPHSGKTGPDLVTIDGRTWADFPAGEGRLMSVSDDGSMDPKAGDFSMVAVFRSTYNGSTAGVICGKIGANDPHYGLFVGTTNSRSLYYQHRDNGSGFGPIDVVDHDIAGYNDGSTVQACVVFDTSANTLKLYGADFSSVVDTDSPATEGTIGPSNDLFFGDWSTSFNRKHEGEIAEVLFFSGKLTGSQLTDIESYLQAKWGYT